MTMFTFNPAEFVPYKNQEVLERCRNMRREEMEFTNENGYTIRVVEQNPQINEIFQRDIYHNILFNYLILTGYLEDERDRKAPAPVKTKKRSLKPKFIKEIIEELTEDYDLPDIEIRKVLIEELTREQLLLEEEAERLVSEGYDLYVKHYNGGNSVIKGVLSAEQIKSFKTNPYYNYECHWVVQGGFVCADNALVTVVTTTGKESD